MALREKTKQIGFRATPEFAERLKNLAFDRRSTVQTLIEEAVDLYLAKNAPENRDPFAGFSAEDADFIRDVFDHSDPGDRRVLRDALQALRYGDPDMVEMLRLQIRMTLRTAAKPDAKKSRRSA